MQIKINRFCLRHENEMHKAGSIVEIEDEDMARKIVANSAGNFSFYHPEDEAVQQPGTQPVTPPAAPQPQEGTSGQEDGEDGTEEGLPAPDFEGAVTK